MLELSEELISASLAREEPAESREWRIHTTSSIDSRSDLESDDICISLDLFPSFEESPESYRF